MSDAQVVVLGVACLLAIVSLGVAVAATRRLGALEARLRAKPIDGAAAPVSDKAPTVPGKAHVRVAIVGLGRNHRAVVSNVGAGSAQAVTLSVEPTAEHRQGPLVQKDAEEKLPLPALGPGEHVSLLATVSSATGSRFEARLAWINEDGSREEWRGVVIAP